MFYKLLCTKYQCFCKEQGQGRGQRLCQVKRCSSICEKSFSKGHLISKCFFGVFNSSKKQTKTIFFVHLLEGLKIQNRHFEINWPLDLQSYPCFYVHSYMYILRLH